MAHLADAPPPRGASMNGSPHSERPDRHLGQTPMPVCFGQGNLGKTAVSGVGPNTTARPRPGELMVRRKRAPNRLRQAGSHQGDWMRMRDHATTVFRQSVSAARRGTLIAVRAVTIGAAALLASREVSAQYICERFSPTPGSAQLDGAVGLAQFRFPRGIAIDAAGTVYVADSRNHTLRKVAQDGTVTTLAGLAEVPGFADGWGPAARFDLPFGIAVGAEGSLYVADRGNHTIRRVSPDGEVTTLAGSAREQGATDGTRDAARFFKPSGIAVDSAGILYVTDTLNHAIRRITTEGVVTTLAGLLGESGLADGTRGDARLAGPMGITVDPAGDIIVGENARLFVRKVTPTGEVTTLASGGGRGSVGRDESVDPVGVATDVVGNIYLTDFYNHALRKLSPQGLLTTFAGVVGRAGHADGPALTALFDHPYGVAADIGGTLYVADAGNHVIRRVSPSGNVTTLAGRPGEPGSVDGAGTDARLDHPFAIATDRLGDIFLADTFHHVILKATRDGTVTILAGEPGQSGNSDGATTQARFFRPSGIALDGKGAVLVADTGNHTIRKVATNGAVITLAGMAGRRGAADGTGDAARFSSPSGLTMDPTGNLYVADRDNHTIRMVASDGRVTTVAGAAGQPGTADGPGRVATFQHPIALVADGTGNLYVADTDNHTVRKVSAMGSVFTLAGAPGESGSTDGTGNAARFRTPSGIAVDATGNVYVADTGNHTIRRITTEGVVTTIAGLAGEPGWSSRSGHTACFRHPYAVAVDPTGVIFVADSQQPALVLCQPAAPSTRTRAAPSGK